VNRTGDSCHLQPTAYNIQPPTPRSMTHDTCSSSSINQSLARLMHPAVLSNIFLRESTLFMSGVFLKSEIWKYETWNKKTQRRSSEIKSNKTSKGIYRREKNANETNCAWNDILTGRASASLGDRDFILETERSFDVRPKLHKARRLLKSQTRS
jgi:hypothetical protein